MASDNQLAGTPSNMGFGICVSVNVTKILHYLINF